MNPTASLDLARAESSTLASRRSGWVWLAFGAYAFGVFLRAGFILFWHRAVDHLYSDALAYFETAKRFCDPNYVPNIVDTIFPPGGGLYFGVLMQLDATMEFAMRVQCVLSALVPLLMLGIARRLFGERYGLFALAVSSLYFSLYEYFGYFLSEGPFLFFLLLSFYLLAVSLTSRRTWTACLAGCGAGLALGSACAFKSIALLSAAMVFVALLWMYRRQKFRLGATLAASAVGLLCVLAPVSVRATRLNEGKFLLIANEAHRSFLLGHQGRIGRATWTDEKRGYFHEFGCPVATQKGYRETVALKVGVYEGAEQYRMAWAWIAANPGEAFLQSVEHAADLCYGSVAWPGAVQSYVSWVVFFNHLFIFLLLFPAAMHLWLRRSDFFRFHPALWGDWLVFLPVVSVFLTAFLFVGEPRYRIPYDAFMILLASRAYCRARLDEPCFLASGTQPEAESRGAIAGV